MIVLMRLFRKCLPVIALVLLTLPAAAQATGKEPVIIIPGITGSSLINSKTGKTVWFNVRRDKTDDLRLPMTSPVLSSNRDSLVPGDLIRKVELPILPDVEVYQALIDALEARGYREARWESPAATDVYYVFPYDWRRDNVETAQILMRKIVAVKQRLRRPSLKFNILAHSMGGLVARYAAMYGSADLPAEGRPISPTWAGAPHIKKLMMFGTPNEGTFSALESLIDGYAVIADRKLPLIDDFRAEDVMSSPSVFQLLPHRGPVTFLDSDLKPVQVDLYDVETWLKYDWSPLKNDKFLSKLRDAAVLARQSKNIKPERPDKDAGLDDRIISQTTSTQIRAYLRSVLSRAKRFHLALDADTRETPIELYAFGGNCQQTPAAALIVRDDKKEKWETVLDPKDVKTSDGRTLKKDDLRPLLTAPGDGRVTQRSLLTIDSLQPGARQIPIAGASIVQALFPLRGSLLACGTHTRLFLDKPIQDSFLSALVVGSNAHP